MAKPRQWQLSNGSVAQVQTPETQRAKELFEIYKKLSNPIEAIDQRLDVLLKVKWTVQEYAGTDISKDIADLVDREADLLNRGRPLKSMEQLRIRLSHLFLEFIENPDFNPRAQEFVGIAVKTKQYL